MVEKEVDLKDISDSLAMALNKIDILFNTENRLSVPSGFENFDNAYSGFINGDLIILAGISYVGKSIFAMNVALNAAVHGGKSIAWFSKDGSVEDFTLKMISHVGTIDMFRLESGRLIPEDWPKLNSAVNTLAKSHFYIDDSGCLGTSDLCNRVTALNEKVIRRKVEDNHNKEILGDQLSERGVELIVVDNLSSLFQFSSEEEMFAVTLALKQLAKQLNIPIIALFQIKPTIQLREDKKPLLSDLPHSIELNADEVFFLHHRNAVVRNEENICNVDFLCRKHRGGIAKNHVSFAFDRSHLRFEEIV